MSSVFLLVSAAVAVALAITAWSVVVAMQRAASGGTAVHITAHPGRPGEEIALRLRLHTARGRSQVIALAVEGDLARALGLEAPAGFVPYETRPLRYEEFEPDLEEIADRLHEERPGTVEISRCIEKLQREQFDEYARLRQAVDAVQFTGALEVGPDPVELALPGHAIPEAAGRVWITTRRRIGTTTVEDVAVVELPLDEAGDEGMMPAVALAG